jgi:putative ABC transport system permease protein
MYVHTLEDVVKMRDRLNERGIEAYTLAREVETLQHLRLGLLAITMVIGGVTVSGMALALSSYAVSGVKRKDRTFAQIRLMGFRSRDLLLFPVSQTVLSALLAASLALFVYRGAAWGFDALWRAWLREGESACHIPFSYVVGLYFGALVLACVCNIGAVGHLLHLQPAEVLRRDA